MLNVPAAMKTDLLSNAPETYVTVRAYGIVDDANALIPFTSSTQSSNGITLAASGSTVTIHGTATADVSFTLQTSRNYRSVSIDSDNPRFTVDAIYQNDLVFRYTPQILYEPFHFFTMPDKGSAIRINIRSGVSFDHEAFTFRISERRMVSPATLGKSTESIVWVTRREYKSVELSVGTSTGGLTVGETLSCKLTVECLTSIAHMLLPDGYDETNPTILYVRLEHPDVPLYDSPEVGTFYVSKAESEFRDNYSTIVAYDALGFQRFDRKLMYDDPRFMVDTTGNGTPDTNLGMGASADLAAEYLEESAGVLFANTSDLVQFGADAQQHEINTIQLLQHGDGLSAYTLRNCIGILAANNYANVIADPSAFNASVWLGEFALKFIKPNTGDSVSIGPSNYKLGGFSPYETSQKTIDGIRVFFRSSETTNTWTLFDSSGGGNALVVPQDMSWRFTNESCANALYQNGAVYDDVLPRTLTFGRIECFGLPFVQPFDHVLITDTNGDTYDIQPCSVTHRYDGGWHSTLECADTLDEEGGTVISASANYDYVPDAPKPLMSGESNGWKYVIDSDGHIHAWTVFELDLTGYAATTSWSAWGSSVNTGPTVNLPFEMAETTYTVVMSMSHWRFIRLYPIVANNTTTSFQFAFNINGTSSDTTYIPMILDGVVDMSAI